MRFLINTGLVNRKIKRTAAKQKRNEMRVKRRPEVVSVATKRMDRPHKIDAANKGYEKIQALTHRGIKTVVSQMS